MAEIAIRELHVSHRPEPLSQPFYPNLSFLPEPVMLKSAPPFIVNLLLQLLEQIFSKNLLFFLGNKKVSSIWYPNLHFFWQKCDAKFIIAWLTFRKFIFNFSQIHFVFFFSQSTPLRCLSSGSYQPMHLFPAHS